MSGRSEHTLTLSHLISSLFPFSVLISSHLFLSLMFGSGRQTLVFFPSFLLSLSFLLLCYSFLSPDLKNNCRIFAVLCRCLLARVKGRRMYEMYFSPSISLSPSLFLSFFCVCMCVCKQFSFEFARSSNPYTVCHDCLFYPYESFMSPFFFFSLARSLIYSFFFFPVFCARVWFFFSNLNIRSAFFFLPLHSDLYPSFRILHI